MMKKDFDLLSLGEILLRLSPPNNERIVRGETFQKQVGGAELNVVSGVSLLGLRTGVISKLPANALGTYAKNRVRFCGVSDDYLVYDHEDRSYPRKPSVVYDRRHASFCKISLDELPESMFSSARCFHTSGITLALSENTRKVGIEMMKRFKENGTLISFDVNFRGNLWTGPEAKECIESILPYVDISGALYGLLAHNFDCQKALEYGNATSSVKNTIPGDLPSCGLEEIDRIIKNHKNTGIQLEMDR